MYACIQLWLHVIESMKKKKKKDLHCETVNVSEKRMDIKEEIILMALARI